MSDPDTTTEEWPAGAEAGGPAETEPEPATLVEGELLVEEISIDGMCGVY